MPAPPSSPAPRWQVLSTLRIARVARKLPGLIGVYARTLAPGAPLAAYHAGEHFPTASVIKVLVMTTAYVKQETHPGALSAVIVFRSGDLIGGSDFMASARDGQRFTVAELIVPMITVSDNTAANLLIGHFGVHAINAVGKRAGMTRTHLARKFLDYTAIAHHNDNVSTPADMGHLLYLIELGAHEGIPTIVSPRHCRADARRSCAVRRTATEYRRRCRRTPPSRTRPARSKALATTSPS